LDRLLDLGAGGHLSDLPTRDFETHRQLIRDEICQRAWNPALNSYVAELDGDALDASLLLLAWYGFEDPSSERMRATYERVQKELGAQNGLFYRYLREESAGEGAFGICSFWAAEYLARGGGSVEQARAAFEHLLTYGNDIGLFAEEIDPRTGEALGNFPQAFTHVGLINAALSLRDRSARERPADT
jgi:GH15 family glucan-1,4-alpha-glucosidase